MLRDHAEQAEVFDLLREYANDVMLGFNVCALVYGATRSGKTYTTLGDSSAEGLALRTMDHIFDVVAKQYDNYEYSISASYCEIYDDFVCNLLLKDQPKASCNVIRDETWGTSIANAGEKRAAVVELSSTSDLATLLENGQQMMSAQNHPNGANPGLRRRNASRLLTIYVAYTSIHTGKRAVGRVQFVDLADYEQTSVGTTTLGNCFEAMAKQHADVYEAFEHHVPFEDSALTRLLQPSFQRSMEDGSENIEKCRALVLACVSPAHNSALSTKKVLDFTQEVRHLPIGPATRQLKPERDGH